MPRLLASIVGGLTAEIDFANNGRITGIVASNAGVEPVRVAVELTDGRIFAQAIPPGTTDVATNVPPNAASIAIDGQGEATITGIAYIRVGG